MSTTQPLRPAIFLDRDGTLAHEVGYINHISRFRLYPFAPAAIRAINGAGWAAVVVTNQAGVARGYFPESLVGSVHEEMRRGIEGGGAKLDAVYYCPHHPEAGVPPYRSDCDCRKPRPGMVRRAALELSLDLERSWVIGDRLGDLELAWSVGARGALVKTGYGAGDLAAGEGRWRRQPDLVAENAFAAVHHILGEAGSVS
jgi:D-glycero-D-manno-heptose 1,7-bisphosphate phosphatase